MFTMQNDQKVVLITGISIGMGESYDRCLAQYGFIVYEF